MASEFDFVDEAACEQGATFHTEAQDRSFDFSIDDEPLDMTGLEFRMQVRRKAAETTVLAEFVSSGLSAVGSAPANGTIVLGDDDDGGNNNRITLQMSATNTAAIPAGLFVYDLESVSSTGEVVRRLQGKFQVTANVTRGGS